ncbi:cell division protein FtsQ/DivIB [Streptomyces syringium]|uniref:cell division protein FtsQ/DivIB n=1 Tax=Streptomyces syringium TaxID=76729 RepID=UPI0033EC4DCD
MAGPTTARRGGGKNGKPPRSRQSPRPPRSGGPPGKAKPRRPRLRLRPRRRRLLGWAAVTVVLGAAAGWALYGSSWLRVTHVEVSGTAVLTSGEVRREADVPFGDPLASVDTDAIADRLRDRLPRIESVAVERSWPRGISLKVTERQPKAVLEKGGKFIEIDGTGVRFATVDQAPKGVPRLAMTAEDSAGTRRFGPERLEREAVRVAVDLPPAVRRDTLAIRVRSYDSITLELTGGRTVVWGSGERGDAKARTLTALLKAARGADHFDVSAPGAPAASGS